MTYNPSEIAIKGSLFGLPYSLENSELVIIPVINDVTTSYGQGTAKASKKILLESSQLDLSLLTVKTPWKFKVFYSNEIGVKKENKYFRKLARKVITQLESKSPKSKKTKLWTQQINDYCKNLHQFVEASATDLLKNGKQVALVGGDHSSPLGLIRALSSFCEFSILQIDAHMDLRDSYCGFDYSHASIMHNVLKENGVKSLTQVGIRDFCEEEIMKVRNINKKIYTFYDEQIYDQEMTGNDWQKQTEKIIGSLSNNVYISFDIDGLTPSLCPHTGTPVPGGLSFHKVSYLLNKLMERDKKIIGFDLCEVGNATWDANVGARILYKLCASMGVSQKYLKKKKN